MIPTQPKLILLGDDDIDDQELFAEAMKKVDGSFELRAFMNGENLLEFLHSLSDPELPSLILMDYNLPRKNGAEIIAEISQFPRYKSIPKLIWSTSTSVVYKKNSFDSGATDYLIKPFNYDNLLMIVKQILSFSTN